MMIITLREMLVGGCDLSAALLRFVEGPRQDMSTQAADKNRILDFTRLAGSPKLTDWGLCEAGYELVNLSSENLDCSRFLIFSKTIRAISTSFRLTKSGLYSS